MALCWCLGSCSSNAGIAVVIAVYSELAICFCKYVFSNIFYEVATILGMHIKLRNPRRNQIAPINNYSNLLQRCSY